LTRIVPTAVGRRLPALSGDRKVEILGIAGAGKSTLATLLDRDAEVEMATFIHARRPSHLVQIVRGIPRLLPILISGLTRSPRISWPEFKLLVYVTRWRLFLGRPAAPGAVLLFDQGPLYALVRLKAEGKPFTTYRAFGRWSEEMLGSWVSELTTLVFLDAPDPVLWSRINQRPQDHKAKGEEAKAGLRFIARYRRTFEDVIRRVEELGGPQILRFDTSVASATQIADKVKPLLEDRHGR
jgi:deoxyadenosine/deoxycytidine kinase